MKRLLTLLLVFLMVFSLVGCGEKPAAGPKGNTAGDTIKIGWIGSLTGDQAVWGTCESNTLQMLVDEANAAGGWKGKQLELVPLDYRGIAEESLTAARRLTTQDNVIAIIGPNTSGGSIALTPAVETSGVPAISTVGTNPLVTVTEDGAVKPFNFRVCFIDPYQGAVAAGYAYDVLGLRKAAVLYDQSIDYSKGLTEFFEKQFVHMGGEIVAKEAFNAGDTEFKTQLTKIKEADPQILFLPYFFKEVALTANQAEDIGLNVVMMGGDGWPSEQLMKMAKDSLQGDYFVNHLDYKDPAVADFNKQYMDAFGIAPELNGYLAYDAFLVLKAAVEKAENINSVEIAKALETVEVQGITGFIRMDAATHNPVGKDAAILKIEGDEYVFQQKYSIVPVE